MSYSDDEELNIGATEEGLEDDLDLDGDINDPILDDDLVTDEDDDLDGFAGLDGSAEY